MQRQTKERQVVQAQVQACSSKTSCSHGLGDTLSNRGPMGIRIDCCRPLNLFKECVFRTTISVCGPRCWPKVEKCVFQTTISVAGPRYWPKVAAVAGPRLLAQSACHATPRSLGRQSSIHQTKELDTEDEKNIPWYCFFVYLLISIYLDIMAPRQEHKPERDHVY